MRRALLAVAFVVAATALPSSVVTASSPLILDWPGSEANHASYWDAYFGHPGACTKVDRGGEFTTTRAHSAIVIKNDQRNFIYQPAPAGTYTTDKGVSHWFKCDWGKTPPPPPPWPPEPSFISYMKVCGDPRIIGAIQNTGTKTFTVRLRFTSAATGDIVKVERTLSPWEGWTFKRWVKGKTRAWLRIVGTDIYPESVYVSRANNIGACPRQFTTASGR